MQQVKEISDTLLISDSLIQVESYTYEQARQLLEIGDTTLRDRIKCLALVPERRGKAPIINQTQFLQIQALNQHIKEGGSIATFKELPQTAELTEPATQLESINSGRLSELNSSEIWSEPLRNIRDEMMMNSLVQKHLRLEVYSRLDKPISDADCIEILEFKPPRTGFRESHFQFDFYGYSSRPGKKVKILKDGTETSVSCLVKQKLWKIKKVDLDAENQAKLAAKRNKKQQEEDGEVKAIANYENVKNLINDD